MQIGNGITLGSGLTFYPDVPSGIITNGLKMYLDPTKSSSYPGSGSTWYDISGNNNNVTLTGSPTFGTKYFSFNGSSQYGTGSGTPMGVNAYTKCFWLNISSLSYSNNTLSSSTGGHFSYLAGTNKLYNGHSNWGNYLAYPSATTFTTNRWYHICLTFDTTNGMTLYVNGALDSTYTDQKTGLPGNGECDIAQFSNGNLLDGYIGIALCYNRAITSTENLQNFNTTRATYGI
jgi:hypothetical protein